MDTFPLSKNFVQSIPLPIIQSSLSPQSVQLLCHLSTKLGQPVFKYVGLHNQLIIISSMMCKTSPRPLKVGSLLAFDTQLESN